MSDILESFSYSILVRTKHTKTTHIDMWSLLHQ